MKKIKNPINLIFTFLSFFLVQTFITTKALARPEYATKLNLISCSICHVNPWGGGARTMYGKLFGSRDYNPTIWAKKDVFSLDFRSMIYGSQRTTASPATKGMYTMNAIPTLNFPLVEEEGADPKAHLVVSSNLATPSSLREAYFMMNFVPTADTALFKSLVIGNFNVPFGLLTDEHRTYTRVMVNSSNRDFDSGAVLSGEPSYSLHYDLALTSGFQSGNLMPGSAPADAWGAVFNIRFMPFQGPLQLGLSRSENGTSALNYTLDATSLYGIAAINNLGNIQAEVVSAHGWNNSTYNNSAGAGINYFIPSSTWLTALTNSQSLGLTTFLNWDMTNHLTFQLKHEEFIPDQNFTADYFYRTGIGLKYYFQSSAYFIARYDHGEVQRAGLSNSDLASIKAIGDEYFLLLHAWL